LRSRNRDSWALLAGAGFGMAFLTRPSSILLLIPILFSLRLKPKTILFFCLGGLPLAVIFFVYNTVAYGHPLTTGYGQIGLQKALGFSGFADRFNHYFYWIKVTMSPLALLCWLGVAADRKVYWRDRAMLIGWFGAFFLFYCCYSSYDEWWYTRFLLPAYPALILGILLIARDLPALFRRSICERNQVRLGWVVLIIMVAVTMSHEKRYNKRFEVFKVRAKQEHYPASCRWADQQLPDHSMIVSMEMSGALKFYTTRPIVRWDWIPLGAWPVVKKHAAERGYHLYALLQPTEVAEVQKLLAGNWTKLGTLSSISLWRIELPAD
jgi:4-amino-4-deoxy-L-arabinose transferase-like glycosyltransferase